MRTGLILIQLLIIVVSGLSQEQRYVYDNVGRLTQVLSHTGTLTTYQYDANGNRISSKVTPCAVRKRVAISGKTVFCDTDSTILTADSSTSYKWSNGSTTRSIVVKSNATVEVFTTNVYGCKDTARVTVTVNPPPTITIQQNPSVVCVGSSVTLTASGAASYSWSGPSITSLTGTTISITPTVSGSIYSVSGKNANGCEGKKEISVTLTSPVTPKAVLSSSGCQGNSVTFTTVVTNGGVNPAIQWQTRTSATSSWSDTVGQTSTTFVATNMPVGTQVRYKLTSNAPCVTTPTVFSDSAIIICVVTAIPIIDGMERFAISPNPNSGSFTVNMKFNTITKVSFKVINEMGQIVHNIPAKSIFGTHTQTIRIPQPISGTYYLVSTVDKTTFTEKIIVVR